MKLTNLIKHFIIDVLTSGKYYQDKKMQSSDYLIRYSLMNIMSFIFLPTFAINSIGTIKNLKYLEFSSFVFLTITSIVSIIISRKKCH
jgi:hypothetical protein